MIDWFNNHIIREIVPLQGAELDSELMAVESDRSHSFLHATH
jgi:hypothetical protein